MTVDSQIEKLVNNQYKNTANCFNCRWAKHGDLQFTDMQEETVTFTFECGITKKQIGKKDKTKINKCWCERWEIANLPYGTLRQILLTTNSEIRLTGV